MTHAAHFTLTFPDLDEPGLCRLAEVVALKLLSGDAVLLRGSLGAGKTTFARALIRAVLDDEGHEVPSPTFAIAQHYDGGRLDITHYDLYRLASPDELVEIGFEDSFRDGAVLIEWPDRADGLIAGPRWEVTITDAGASTDVCPPGREVRDVVVKGTGDAAERLARVGQIQRVLADFAADAGATVSAIRHIKGDASTRSYARVRIGNGQTVILMDAPTAPDGPVVADNLPYSRLVHLAEDVARPFLAIGETLAATGLSTPSIHFARLDDGLLVIEDLGDAVYDALVRGGGDPVPLWTTAVDALVHLRRADPPSRMTATTGDEHVLPLFDRRAALTEARLMLDWAWPASVGAEPHSDRIAAFDRAWTDVLDGLAAERPGWMLRDYHSPNLIRLDDRMGIAAVGIIDYQDAVLGHWAYDLASLLQDARVDLPDGLEAEMLDRYCAAVASFDRNFDEQRFRAAYAVYGAQRATKIIGIFHRLARRDGKPAYLTHLPRIWGYLRRNLEHDALAPVALWHRTCLDLDS